jgi:chromosome segregation ATPase
VTDLINYQIEWKLRNTKEELKQEEQELKKILTEKEKLINDLVNKAHLREEEKEQFLKELQSKEESLNEAQQEMNFLRRRLIRDKNLRKHVLMSDALGNEMLNFIRGPLLAELGGPESVLQGPSELIRKKFRRLSSELPNSLLKDLDSQGVIDSNRGLTEDGIMLLRKQAREAIDM